MPSERQREANRRNGRLGGPKTQDGKRSSRRNSLRHGLTSTTLVLLPGEDGREYEEILRGFRESLKPGGALEDALVARLAQTHWRGLRSRRVETGMLDITAASQRGLARQVVEDCPEHLDPHKAIGVVFMTAPPHQWHNWLRYDTTISRDFFRTLDTLTRLRHARRMKRAREPSVMVSGSVRFRDSVRFAGSPSMKRTGKTRGIAGPDEPIDTLGELLAQLTWAAGKKGSHFCVA